MKRGVLMKKVLAAMLITATAIAIVVQHVLLNCLINSERQFHQD